MKTYINFILIASISICISGCASMQNQALVEDDIYFNSKDIAKEKAQIALAAQKKQTQIESTSSQSSSSNIEDDYYDEDYTTKCLLAHTHQYMIHSGDPHQCFLNPAGIAM